MKKATQTTWPIRSGMKKQLKSTLESLPEIDLEAAHAAFENGSEVPDNFPEGWRWLVAIDDALKLMTEAEQRIHRLNMSILTFKDLFDRGYPWPGTKPQTTGSDKS